METSITPGSKRWLLGISPINLASQMTYKTKKNLTSPSTSNPSRVIMCFSCFRVDSFSVGVGGDVVQPIQRSAAHMAPTTPSKPASHLPRQRRQGTGNGKILG